MWKRDKQLKNTPRVITSPTTDDLSITSTRLRARRLVCGRPCCTGYLTSMRIATRERKRCNHFFLSSKPSEERRTTHTHFFIFLAVDVARFLRCTFFAPELHPSSLHLSSTARKGTHKNATTSTSSFGNTLCLCAETFCTRRPRRCARVTPSRPLF